jgi:DNA repair metallo-beta-lactamase
MPDSRTSGPDVKACPVQVPYSEHSSFEELRDMVATLQVLPASAHTGFESSLPFTSCVYHVGAARRRVLVLAVVP